MCFFWLTPRKHFRPLARHQKRKLVFSPPPPPQHAKAYQHGKLCILAFDGFYDRNGKYRSSNTTLFVPNTYVFDLSREFPEYFIPVGSVNPYRADALEELQKCADNGVTIIKWLVSGLRSETIICMIQCVRFVMIFNLCLICVRTE